MCTVRKNLNNPNNVKYKVNLQEFSMDALNALLMKIANVKIYLEYSDKTYNASPTRIYQQTTDRNHSYT